MSNSDAPTATITLRSEAGGGLPTVPEYSGGYAVSRSSYGRPSINRVVSSLNVLNVSTSSVRSAASRLNAAINPAAGAARVIPVWCAPWNGTYAGRRVVDASVAAAAATRRGADHAAGCDPGRRAGGDPCRPAEERSTAERTVDRSGVVLGVVARAHALVIDRGRRGHPGSGLISGRGRRAPRRAPPTGERATPSARWCRRR